jgi:hypothetical protein
MPGTGDDPRLIPCEPWHETRPTTSAAVPPAPRAPIYKSLFAQVVVGLVLGVALGVLAPGFD